MTTLVKTFCAWASAMTTIQHRRRADFATQADYENYYHAEWGRIAQNLVILSVCAGLFLGALLMGIALFPLGQGGVR
jgi:hypothetical protein